MVSETKVCGETFQEIPAFCEIGKITFLGEKQGKITRRKILMKCKVKKISFRLC